MTEDWSDIEPDAEVQVVVRLIVDPLFLTNFSVPPSPWLAVRVSIVVLVVLANKIEFITSKTVCAFAATDNAKRAIGINTFFMGYTSGSCGNSVESSARPIK